jgi:hypothetical protein
MTRKCSFAVVGRKYLVTPCGIVLGIFANDSGRATKLVAPGGGYELGS